MKRSVGAFVLGTTPVPRSGTGPLVATKTAELERMVAEGKRPAGMPDQSSVRATADAAAK